MWSTCLQAIVEMHHISTRAGALWIGCYTGPPPFACLSFMNLLKTHLLNYNEAILDANTRKLLCCHWPCLAWSCFYELHHWLMQRAVILQYR